MAATRDTEQPEWSSIDDKDLALILSLMHVDAHEALSVSRHEEIQAENIEPDAQFALQLHIQELSRATVYVSDRKLAKTIDDAPETGANVTSEPNPLEVVAPNNPLRATAVSGIRRCGHGLRRNRVGDGSKSSTIPFHPADDSDEEPESSSTAESRDTNPIPSVSKPKYALLPDPADDSDKEPENSSTAESRGTNPIPSVSRPKYVVLFDPDDDPDGEPESSSTAVFRGTNKFYGQKKPESEDPGKTCCVCGKTMINRAVTSCKHKYCYTCIQDYFRTTMLEREIPRPPRCCGKEIWWRLNRRALGEDLFNQIQKKVSEPYVFKYCHRPTCSAIIPPSYVKNGVGNCIVCKSETCVKCMDKLHSGECADNDLLQLARKEKWRRCPSCSTMVELESGCYHITCRCSAEFCYICGETWKKCDCPRGPN